MKKLGVGLTLAALLATSVLLADTRREGQPPFDFAAWFTEVPTLGKPGTLFVLLTPLSNTRQVVRIHPGALVVLSGDTSRVVSAASQSDWLLQLAPLALGHFVIRALAVVEWDSTRDEVEIEVPLDVNTDGARASPSRSIREERVVGKQRFRFGDQFLVPIDSSEYVVERDIDIAGKLRPFQLLISDDSTGIAFSDTVTCVVFLDSEGRLNGFRILNPKLKDNREVERSVGTTLRQATFRPSKAKGREVADWRIVRIPVPSRH